MEELDIQRWLRNQSIIYFRQSSEERSPMVYETQILNGGEEKQKACTMATAYSCKLVTGGRL